MFEHGELGCLPGNFNKIQKHKKMLINLKGMGFNSVFNFLKIPSHVYFFFQSCLCFSFPCIIFCPTTSSSILLILYYFKVFNLFFFFLPLSIFYLFPLFIICMAFLSPWTWVFSFFLSDLVLPVVLVLPSS